MKLIAPADVYLVALGDSVKAGDVVEVDADVGVSLVAQGWKSAPEAKKTLDGVTDGA